MNISPFSLKLTFQEKLFSVKAFFHMTKFSLCLLTGNYLCFSCMIFTFFRKSRIFPALFCSNFLPNAFKLFCMDFQCEMNRKKCIICALDVLFLLQEFSSFILFLVKCGLIIMHRLSISCDSLQISCVPGTRNGLQFTYMQFRVQWWVC